MTIGLRSSVDTEAAAAESGGFRDGVCGFDPSSAVLNSVSLDRVLNLLVSQISHPRNEGKLCLLHKVAVRIK